MELYPDEQLYLLGFSYGGAAAIEFAHLLNDFGGGTYKGTSVPDVSIRGLILIDAVRTYRYMMNYQLYEGLTDYSIPGNVGYAINLFATDNYLDAYKMENPWGAGFLNGIPGLLPMIGALNPVDQGMQAIVGAFNIPVAGTNHCSIGYASCPVQHLPYWVPVSHEAVLDIGPDLPYYLSQDASPNPMTITLIKALMLSFEQN